MADFIPYAAGFVVGLGGFVYICYSMATGLYRVLDPKGYERRKRADDAAIAIWNKQQFDKQVAAGLGVPTEREG